MKVTRVFKLEQAARRGGGDKYEEICATGELPMMKHTYIEQWLTRLSKSPAQILTITIEVPEATEVAKV